MTTVTTLCPVPEPPTVADALALSLADWGVGAVYGVSGANIEHLHDAIHRHGGDRLRSVAARSESGAAFMADAHARVHGSLGVCCSTSGGGMMNLAVGIAESYQEGIPVLAIVGQIPRPFEGLGGFQDSSGIGQTVNAEAMWRAIAKDVRSVRSGETLWDDLLGAVQAALDGRKGPAVLLVPRDVFDERVPEQPQDWPESLEQISAAPPVDEAAIEALHGHLERAKRPVSTEPRPAPVAAKPKRAKKGSEAMFMGLGDIIFPGMLVLSAIQWLDDSAAFEVAMATLVGSLLGYLALMTYVARGKAQAGLPLLNGGAILGFFIGGLLFLGGDIFSFNISW